MKNLANYGVPARGETFFHSSHVPTIANTTRKFRFESVRSGLTIDFSFQNDRPSRRTIGSWFSSRRGSTFETGARYGKTGEFRVLEHERRGRNCFLEWKSHTPLRRERILTKLCQVHLWRTTSTDLIVIYVEMDQVFRELFVKRVIYCCICVKLCGKSITGKKWE